MTKKKKLFKKYWGFLLAIAVVAIIAFFAFGTEQSVIHYGYGITPLPTEKTLDWNGIDVKATAPVFQRLVASDTYQLCDLSQGEYVIDNHVSTSNSLAAYSSASGIRGGCANYLDMEFTVTAGTLSGSCTNYLNFPSSDIGSVILKCEVTANGVIILDEDNTVVSTNIAGCYSSGGCTKTYLYTFSETFTDSTNIKVHLETGGGGRHTAKSSISLDFATHTTEEQAEDDTNTDTGEDTEEDTEEDNGGENGTSGEDITQLQINYAVIVMFLIIILFIIFIIYKLIKRK